MNKNIYEEISAYLDGELSQAEASSLEEKIALSEDLQKKVAELKRIKGLTISSVKNLDPSPYLETRIIAELNNENKGFRFKKYIPVFAVIVFTIGLMVLLKFNPQLIDEIVTEQEKNIAGFYKENLKPLLITAGLTKEDIFNFAFYRQLPLNQTKKQYLKLGSLPNGEDYFEIQTASFNEEEDNFEKFIKALNLNQKQKIQIDSILESYAEEMQGQILVNENHTVAINPNLWNYNKAIFADIMAFAEDANKAAFTKVIPAGYTFYDKPTVDKIVKEIKSKKNNNYIFFTPDTIFSEEFVFDKEKFAGEMKKMREQFSKEREKMNKEMRNFSFNFKADSNFIKFKNDSSWNKNFKVFIDSNSCTVHLSKIEIPKINFPDFDSLAKHIEEATKNLKFSFILPDIPQIHAGLKFKIDTLNSYNFNFTIPDVDSLINFHFKMKDSSFNYNGRNFNFKIDSLVSRFKVFGDSSFHFNPKDFEEGMQEFRKEMERFRKEMQQFRRELKRDSTEFEESEILEI